MYRHPPENTNSLTISLTVSRFPGGNRYFAELHQPSPKKTGSHKQPFFPISILLATKVKICHPKGSVRDIFQALKKPISPKNYKNSRWQKRDLFRDSVQPAQILIRPFCQNKPELRRLYHSWMHHPKNTTILPNPGSFPSAIFMLLSSEKMTFIAVFCQGLWDLYG